VLWTAAGCLVGGVRAGHLSRESRQTSKAAPTTGPRSNFDAERDWLLKLQRTAGNQAVARLLRPSGVPASELPPGATEQSSLPAPPSQSLGNQAVLELIQGAATPPVVIAHSHPDESAAQALASAVMGMAKPDRPSAAARAVSSGGLDPAPRSFFESRFGVDLGDVRVHADPVAAQSAARLGAAAYTVGTDIVMGAGQQAGPNLVTSHEVAHVVRGDAVGRCAVPMVDRRASRSSPRCGAWAAGTSSWWPPATATRCCRSIAALAGLQRGGQGTGGRGVGAIQDLTGSWGLA
jgi:hypothetical protein